MDLKSYLERVEGSEVYDKWRKENQESYLCSFFKIIEKHDKDWWQVDFYDPKKDRITSFVTEKEVKVAGKNSKIFKKQGDVVARLDLENVKVSLDEAMKVVSDLMKRKYHGEGIMNKVIILQNIKETIWNISFITTSFKLLNVKIDAESGDVIEDSYKNILDFRDLIQK